jgi:hypothetical protein
MRHALVDVPTWEISVTLETSASEQVTMVLGITPSMAGLISSGSIAYGSTERSNCRRAPGPGVSYDRSPLPPICLTGTEVRGTRCQMSPMGNGSISDVTMSIARKCITLSISLGLWLTLQSLCNAGVLKADRIVLDVPDGGMTLVASPESVSEFKHPQYDVMLTTEVAGANKYEYWERLCTPGKNDSDAAAAYQVGTLARADQYVYSKISRFSKHGISTPRGSWLQHCLVFRSGELAAKVTIDLPKSTLEKAEFSAAEIDKIFVSARLIAASIEDRAGSDPRIAFEAPDDFVPSSLPTFTFRFKHNRLPFGIVVTLSDPNTYPTAKMLNVISARVWKVGSLARTDEYFYYFVWPDSLPDFKLGFRGLGVTAQVEVSVSKASLDKGDIGIPDIERILASARVVTSSKSQ